MLKPPFESPCSWVIKNRPPNKRIFVTLHRLTKAEFDKMRSSWVSSQQFLGYSSRTTPARDNLISSSKKKRRPNWKPANNTNNNNNNNNNKETLGVGYGQIQWVKAADTVWLLIPHHFLLFLERFFTSIVKSTCWSILSSIYEFHCRVNGARIHVATRFDSM